MDLQKRVMLAFTKKLISTAPGRAHLLNQVATAEEEGENQIFERVLDRVEDPQLQKMIRKHKADEIRHGQLFRAAVGRTGVDPGPVPAELRLLDHLDEASGRMFERVDLDARAIMETYLMLLVIEERAVVTFPLYAEAFRETDPATAAVFD